MRGNPQMRTALGLFAIATTVAAGQIVGTVSSWFGGGGPFQPDVGRPYSAEQVTERVQTLADGTHITQTVQTTKFYRDSAGRTRTEHIFTPPGGVVMVSGPSFIQISDPVAGYRYILNSRDQTARRSAFAPTMQRSSRAVSTNPPPPPAPLANAAVKAAARPHPETSRESLGTQSIEGVIAEGTRMTTTIPEGSVGNDRPITTVSESWTSADLKTIVLSKVSDPRYGDTTTKLTNIVVAEPDPALFQVPGDYSIVDEPAPGVR